MEYIEINGAINLTDVANQLNAISFIQILMNSFWILQRFFYRIWIRKSFCVWKDN